MKNLKFNASNTNTSRSLKHCNNRFFIKPVSILDKYGYNYESHHCNILTEPKLKKQHKWKHKVLNIHTERKKGGNWERKKNRKNKGQRETERKKKESKKEGNEGRKEKTRKQTKLVTKFVQFYQIKLQCSIMYFTRNCHFRGNLSWCSFIVITKYS